MSSDNNNNPRTEEYLPLDKSCKPRPTGKKVPTHFSSSSQRNDPSPPRKVKPISKQKQTSKENPPQQANSTELAYNLVFNQGLSIEQIQEIFTQLSNIKSLKYDKLSQKIKDALIETIFKNNFPKFTKIIDAYSPNLCSFHLLQSIFHGFELAWEWEKFDSIHYFNIYLELYKSKIPNSLNKRFVKWVQDRAVLALKKDDYATLKKGVFEYVNEIVRNHESKRSKANDNEKIIPLVVSFDLQDQIRLKDLVRIVPLQKINEYIDKDQSHRLSKSLQKDNKTPSKMQPQQKIPALVHHSVLELIQKNNLKEVEKILKTHKIPHTNYPEFVNKLETKYLEYIERTYPIFVVDELVHGKVNLIETLIDLYMRRRKYADAEHFMNKYKLRGADVPDMKRVYQSPLKLQDAFGPTQSHVLNQKPEDHFIRLKDFDLHKTNILWIDSLSIMEKSLATHLKKLLLAKEIGLDSESTSGIHVFENSKLELIQIYDPESNMVFLFDVRDFKNDKKKRVRKNAAEQKHSSEKINNESKEKVLNCGKSFEEPIQIEADEQSQMKDQKEGCEEKKEKEQEQKPKEQSQTPNQQNKPWQYFTKIISLVFKQAVIYGHALHTDFGDIIEQLDLRLKPSDLNIMDSQTQFKRHFPQQTKSKLSFLAQKCFGKEISKYEQCSAWDRRPLRKAQKHYAALDAVLPYKLVKWMQNEKE